MIPRIDQFVPFGAPDSPVQRLAARDVIAALETKPAQPASDDALVDLLQRSFSVTLLDALARSKSPKPAPSTTIKAVTPPPGENTPPPATAQEAATPPAEQPAATAAPPPPVRPSATSGNEAAIIQQMAERSAIDSRFLEAIRRAENGGRGREFGVVSVPAPTYRDQARVAADTVRRNVERFEQTGLHAVDPASGRYSDEFIRFFSSRYAPVGAANDPSGLNRYHARNLIRLYAKLSPKSE